MVTGVSAGLALVIMLVGIVGVTLGLGLIVVVSFRQLLQGLEAYNQSFQVNTEVLNQWGQSLKMGVDALSGAGDKLFEVLGGIVASFLNNLISLVAGGVIILGGLAFIMLESSRFGWISQCCGACWPFCLASFPISAWSWPPSLPRKRGLSKHIEKEEFAPCLHLHP